MRHATGWVTRIGFPARTIVFLPRRMKTGSEVCPAPIQWGTEGNFHGGKAAEVCSIPITKVKNGGAIPLPSYVFMA
jgi:hypothetical protein